MFAVPSDPPSTPDRRSFRSIPSTTPAGPPPSATRPFPSFTPKGPPPPSSAFGSSQFGTGRSRQLFPGRNESGAIDRGRRPLPSSPPERIVIDDDANSDDGLAPALTAPEEDSMMVDDSIAQISPGFGFMRSLNASSRFDSPRGNKRTRAGEVLRQAPDMPRRIEGLDIQGYAKGIAGSAGPLSLNEPDDMIVGTELQTEPLLSVMRSRAGSEESSEMAGELLKLWHHYGALTREEVESENVGPSDSNQGLPKAVMLASLLGLLYIPQTDAGERKPVPKALLDWLDENHDPSAATISDVLAQQRRGYYASPNFWDAVYLAMNRGRFGIVIRLLEGARFEDNSEQQFTDQQADGIREVISKAVDTLKKCPALSAQNWDVKDQDWVLFRHQVKAASDELRNYAEQESSGSVSLWGSHLGRSDNLSMSQRSRKIDSNVPFEIYEPLQDMYNQLSGDPADILKSCFDWLEAAVALTVWWDGNEVGLGRGSLAASRHSLSKHKHTREVDLNPLQAYRTQIATSLALALEEEDVREGLDVANDLHLGLACVMLGEVELAIELCKNWSISIASALTELATAGHWLFDADTRGTIENFDKSDLMVLSYGQPTQRSSMKDRILQQYAVILADQKKTFVSSTLGVEMQGWELAMRVLSRLDDIDKAESKVTELLDSMQFTSSEQVDGVLILCSELGFGQHAMNISEKYADMLSDSTHNYGDAIMYYLRAHKFSKAKKVIDVLITSSLVQSAAYPPKSKLDSRMKEFIESPKETLNGLASIDLEAAQRLATWLSGYATLRGFYDLRDEKVEEDVSDAARRGKAAAALLTVISSANDPIRGGLFDPSTEVVVPVNSLLVLLGEALPLLRGPTSAFTLPQLFTLLKAVEDLQTIGPRIYASCEALYQTTLDNAFGSDVPSPRAMLRKETSGMTASSQFSLVGSSMLNSQETGMTISGEDSAVLIKSSDVKRGWDWRKGLKRNLKGEDVLRILRLQLAEKVADAWADGEQSC
ncbi:uncharacterized protein PV09_00827 [Verruconis gallopava]|uniref:Nuclear pore complex protein Nup85 n=1 Tax=Verruconis gallopava TaxID=253628 RepID=A0A0D2AQH1_9PEZI|nr:uncharacterized protein PV09_00827 [Verruconis gallopava]KIW08908.1 hypothetical protein PV09_00827 [Verruconis gallopava]